ncbi:hypothetical protein VNO78_09749 [Psophocarpus tetragonolobus]|uniref:Uncharacterized protein n=1 Tax=Psophocarpus tetragonolobus TaxID=3891 RepID=A0AAN9T718_PSOTE
MQRQHYLTLVAVCVTVLRTEAGKKIEALQNKDKDINGHCRFLWFATWVVAFSTPAVLFVAKQLLGWDQIDPSCTTLWFFKTTINVIYDFCLYLGVGVLWACAVKTVVITRAMQVRNSQVSGFPNFEVNHL